MLDKLLILAVSSLTFLSGTVQGQSAREILEKAENLMRGESHHGTYTMTINRPEWSRSIEFEFWSVGEQKSFIRIQSPAREKGITFLKVDREMWNYIPRINRVIKIPPSMMLQSWMGSDFTNDDLVKESSVLDDYEQRLLDSNIEIDGRTAYHIELIPNEDAPVAWGRIEEWIDKESFVPVKAAFFNERNEQVRTIYYDNVRTLGGRTIPTRITLVEDKKEGNSTVMELQEMEFNIRIGDNVFSQQNLRRKL